MAAFEGPEGVFAAGRDALSDVLRGGSEYVDKLCDPALLEWAAGEVAWAQRYGIRLLGLGVGNQKSISAQEDPRWIEMELEFEPWPET